jgi:hypothetical protein
MMTGAAPTDRQILKERFALRILDAAKGCCAMSLDVIVVSPRSASSEKMEITATTVVR